MGDVFLNNVASPYQPRAVSNQFIGAVIKAGLTDPGSHNISHILVSILAIWGSVVEHTTIDQTQDLSFRNALLSPHRSASEVIPSTVDTRHWNNQNDRCGHQKDTRACCGEKQDSEYP